MAAAMDSRSIGFVYVISSSEGPQKIGHSCHPLDRLRDLQVGSHARLRFAFVGLVWSPHHRRIENSAQKRLASSRLCGEWFDVSTNDAVVTVVKAATYLGVKMTDRTTDFVSRTQILADIEGGQKEIVGSQIIAIDAEARFASADAYARSEKSVATLRAYASDLRDFVSWCDRIGEVALPCGPEIVAAYIASLADAKKSHATVVRRLSSIAYAHRKKEFVDPTGSERVKQVLRGIRRTLGTAPKQKAPATAVFIRTMLKKLPDTIFGARDRALILIGFAAALRRSELVALDVADIERQPEGILVHIRRSKTDQEGQGHTVAVPLGSKLKPVEALDAWLTAAGIKTGPIFLSIQKGGRVSPERLSDQAVALIIKQAAERAKLDPNLFSGHSLRAGFVTSALEAGADTLKVMDVTRHRSVDTLKRYDRRSKAFVGHAGKGFL